MEQKKTIDCKIAVRFIEGDRSTLDYWKEVISRESIIISESPILKDIRNSGYEVKHFEVCSRPDQHLVD